MRKFISKDESGEEIVIFVEHGVLNTVPSRDQAGIKNRLPGLRTEDGRYVNYIAKGRYEIIDENTVIPVTSTDANAI